MTPWSPATRLNTPMQPDVEIEHYPRSCLLVGLINNKQVASQSTIGMPLPVAAQLIRRKLLAPLVKHLQS